MGRIGNLLGMPPADSSKMVMHVHVRNHSGCKTGFDCETTLTATWMRKPLFCALVEPALEAYAQSNADFALRVKITPQLTHEVKISVDGQLVDGCEPASTYARVDGGAPPIVELTLPQLMPIRSSIARAAAATS